MAYPKRIDIKPLNKTVVTELRVTIADMKTRSKVCAAAGAAAIGSGNFVSNDVNIFPFTPYRIDTINTVLIVICFEPIRLSILDSNGNVSTTMVITNQFTFNGSMTSPILLGTDNVNGTRITVAHN